MYLVVRESFERASLSSGDIEWVHGQYSLLAGNLNQSEWPTELPGQTEPPAQLWGWTEPLTGIFVWVLLLSRSSVCQDLSTLWYKPHPSSLSLSDPKWLSSHRFPLMILGQWDLDVHMGLTFPRRNPRAALSLRYYAGLGQKRRGQGETGEVLLHLCGAGRVCILNPRFWDFHNSVFSGWLLFSLLVRKAEVGSNLCQHFHNVTLPNFF